MQTVWNLYLSISIFTFVVMYLFMIETAKVILNEIGLKVGTWEIVSSLKFLDLIRMTVMSFVPILNLGLCISVIFMQEEVRNLIKLNLSDKIGPLQVEIQKKMMQEVLDKKDKM